MKAIAETSRELMREVNRINADPDATFEEGCFAQGIASAVIDVKGYKHEGIPVGKAINPRLRMWIERLKQSTFLRFPRHALPERCPKDPLLFKIQQVEAKGVAYALAALGN